jgi:tRNA(adenine34) deaminase
MVDVMRGRAGDTKPPCPVHDTPERLAALERLVPRIELPRQRIPQEHRDLEHMRFAISRARLGSLPAGRHPLDQSHRPFGCVIVDEGGAVIAYAEGSERYDDPTWHSETEAIRIACRKRGGLLHDCTLYSTHEPCLMCCGAILHSKVSRVVFGSRREDLPDLFRVRPYLTARHLLADTSHPPEVVEGVCRDECIALFDGEREQPFGGPRVSGHRYP